MTKCDCGALEWEPCSCDGNSGFISRVKGELKKHGFSESESLELIEKYADQVKHCAKVNLPDKTATTLMFNIALGLKND